MKRTVLFLMMAFAVILSAKDVAVNFEAKVKATQDKDWSITVNYPKFEGNEMAECNKAIKSVVDSFYDDWKEFFAGDYDKQEGMKFYADMSYEPFYADTDGVSILLYIESFTGGAHPQHEYISFNYDVKFKKMVDVSDMMIDEILPQLADYCESAIVKQIKEKGAWDEMTTVNDIEPTLASFNVVNTTKDSVYFTFNEGRVVAYYLGAFTVEVSIDDLSEMVE